MKRRRTRRLWSGLVALAALGVAGCGDGGGDSGSVVNPATTQLTWDQDDWDEKNWK